jgi:hypothetical protein
MGTHWKQQKNKKNSCGHLYRTHLIRVFAKNDTNAFWPPFYGKLQIGNPSYAIPDSGFVTSNTLPLVASKSLRMAADSLSHPTPQKEKL